MLMVFVSLLTKNLKSIESKEVLVGFDRSPAWIRMMIQYLEAHLLNGAVVYR